MDPVNVKKNVIRSNKVKAYKNALPALTVVSQIIRKVVKAPLQSF